MIFGTYCMMLKMVVLGNLFYFCFAEKESIFIADCNDQIDKKSFRNHFDLTRKSPLRNHYRNQQANFSSKEIGGMIESS